MSTLCELSQNKMFNAAYFCQQGKEDDLRHLWTLLTAMHF